MELGPEYYLIAVYHSLGILCHLYNVSQSGYYIITLLHNDIAEKKDRVTGFT